jgi:aminoglycoside phosphotransferase (APT) family kinase protein
MTAAAPGALVGSGRNADVYDIGDGRVLRRYRDGRDPAQVAAEAAVMVHAHAAGVPVPEVFDVSGADIVMARAAGPTMLDVLARLHGLVHQVPAAGLPGPVRPFPWEMPAVSDPDVLLHRDLHPANVILTAAGPVIIDWEGATRGPAIADIAMTWVIIGFSDVPATSLKGAVVGGVQQLFTRAFVRAAGPLDEEWRLAAIRQRLGDPNLRPAEVARLGKLVPAAPAPDSGR